MIFIIAFIFSFLGSIPPGSINISIVQLGLENRKKAAIRFALASAIIEFPYVLIALQFENWITSSPLVVGNLKIISAAVMIALGAINVYSYLRPIKNTTLIKLKESGFRKGLIISILNPMAIPFWIGVTAYLQNVNWIFLEDIYSKLVYALGVSFGTFSLLLILATFSKKINLNLNRRGFTQLIPALVFFSLGFYALFQVLFID